MFIQMGSKLQTLPDGRIGTVTDMWVREIRLSCDCCFDSVPMITLLFENGNEDDFEEEELRQI